MSGNPLVRFDEGRVGRTSVSPSLLLYADFRTSTVLHWLNPSDSVKVGPRSSPQKVASRRPVSDLGLQSATL